MQEIEDIISRLDLKSEIKQNIINVYKLLAEAESEAHGVEYRRFISMKLEQWMLLQI